MKRFGRYDNDFNGLFECYRQVNSLVVERELPSATRQPTSITTGDSFPGIKTIKVFVQRPGRGADLTNIIDVNRLGSDNGDNGTVISGTEGDKVFDVITTSKGAQIKTYDNENNLENDFVTNIAPRYDSEARELVIIHVEEL
jgi:hypothetical protein